jgi:hypothetical protein
VVGQDILCASVEVWQGGYCVQCLNGMQPNARGNQCVDCPAGRAGDEGACTVCDTGLVAESDGATECTSCAAGKEPNDDSTACKENDTLDGDLEKTDLQTWKKISIVVGISLAGALVVIATLYGIKHTKLSRNFKRSREMQEYVNVLTTADPKWDDKDWLGDEKSTAVSDEDKTVGDVAAAIAAARRTDQEQLQLPLVEDEGSHGQYCHLDAPHHILYR